MKRPRTQVRGEKVGSGKKMDDLASPVLGTFAGANYNEQKRSSVPQNSSSDVM